MNTKVRMLLAVGAFALLLAAAAIVYNTLTDRFAPEVQIADESSPDDAETITAPDFTAYDTDGNEVKLSDYSGKPVVLNFWASWCPPCKSEMPHFDKVSGELEGEVVFLMVDMVDHRRETVTEGKQYIEENGFTFPVLYDSDQSAAVAYGIRSLPTTIFIDSNGVIQGGAEGAINEESLLKGIELIR